jgi:hypothetical protein
MDEARHVEVYRRFIQTKLGNEYEVNSELKKLLDGLAGREFFHGGHVVSFRMSR